MFHYPLLIESKKWKQLCWKKTPEFFPFMRLINGSYNPFHLGITTLPWWDVCTASLILRAYVRWDFILLVGCRATSAKPIEGERPAELSSGPPWWVSSRRMAIVLGTFTSSSPKLLDLSYYGQSCLDAMRALQPLVAKNARRSLLIWCWCKTKQCSTLLLFSPFCSLFFFAKSRIWGYFKVNVNKITLLFSLPADVL